MTAAEMHLIRDAVTGDYYSATQHFRLEKCLKGWDVHELAPDGRYRYSFTVDTLKEFRLIMKNRKDEP